MQARTNQENKMTKIYNPMHGEAKSSKYSSAGNEREMRKNLTHSEKAARAKHIATDTKQHPMFKGRKPDTRG